MAAGRRRREGARRVFGVRDCDRRCCQHSSSRRGWTRCCPRGSGCRDLLPRDRSGRGPEGEPSRLSPASPDHPHAFQVVAGAFGAVPFAYLKRGRTAHESRERSRTGGTETTNETDRGLDRLPFRRVYGRSLIGRPVVGVLPVWPRLPPSDMRSVVTQSGRASCLSGSPRGTSTSVGGPARGRSPRAMAGEVRLTAAEPRRRLGRSGCWSWSRAGRRPR